MPPAAPNPCFQRPDRALPAAPPSEEGTNGAAHGRGWHGRGWARTGLGTDGGAAIGEGPPAFPRERRHRTRRTPGDPAASPPGAVVTREAEVDCCPPPAPSASPAPAPANDMGARSAVVPAAADRAPMSLEYLAGAADGGGVTEPARPSSGVSLRLTPSAPASAIPTVTPVGLGWLAVYPEYPLSGRRNHFGLDHMDFSVRLAEK
jgi:hypothetical protein